MKLKELFDKYTFDDIVPFLKKMIADHPDALPDFRAAFDELRRMEPSKEDCGETLIKEFSDKDGNIVDNPVCWYLGDTWGACLAKRVVIDGDVPLDECYVLAACLWEMTFYGFSNEPDPEDVCSLGYSPKQKNKYDEVLYKLQLSNWKHTTPRRYRSKHHPLCTDADYRIGRWNCSKNRSKRKRDYRVECREKYLEMHSQREDFISKLVRSGAFKREEVEYLHQVESGQYYPYVSRTWDVSKRIDYILESINKYQDVDFSQYDDAIICLRTSSEYPVSEAEKERLLAGLPASLKALPIKIGIGTKEVMKQEIEMMLLLNIMR